MSNFAKNMNHNSKQTLMKNKFERITEIFEREMPVAETELKFGSPFQLLVAVILSAQCTDKRVNIVTESLFRDFPTPDILAAASFDQVYEYVRSVSYPRAKTQHIIEMAKRLVDNFNGEVPSDMDDLLTLPGVGRKTANVMLSVVWGKAAMAVDTHVFRVSHRLGLVSPDASTPLAVEKVLTEGFAPHLLPKAHHWLILHGRYVCAARKPHCSECYLANECAYFKNNS